MIVDTSKPMCVKLSDDDVRMLCEIIIFKREPTEQENRLLSAICYHMIWDDLLEKLPDVKELPCPDSGSVATTKNGSKSNSRN